MRRILITGAASAIASAAARLFAAEGAAFFLVDRTADRLQAVANDLRVRGAQYVATATADLNNFEEHKELIRQAEQQLGGIDTVLIAHGTLPKQKMAEASWEVTERELATNFLSVVSLLTLVANHFEPARTGTIAVISSVAGDRGRQSNYVYGTAKGALTIFLQGLRNRLAKANVHVLTIKPGFVDSPMTAEFKKGLLWVKPHVVGKAIHRAIGSRREVVYVPWFWWGIMLVITAIPERIFKKMKL
ncbi:MAG: SDR family oxidoreductase [Candidatus Andersenbacteria bacterium]